MLDIFTDKNNMKHVHVAMKSVREKQGGWCTFFNMKYYFWHGGNFKLWDPATGFPTEDEDFALWHPFVDEAVTKRLMSRTLSSRFLK